MTLPRSSSFWDALAPYHAAIEDSYLDRRSLRRILPDIRPPALVVGAGQGLIVAELRNHGIPCDGVDLSAEMVRYARLRRGLELIPADARSLPFPAGACKTILYATGVVDFMSDVAEIRAVLDEARRVADPSGSIFVAFYRLSPATEDFVRRLGLLANGALRLRELLRMYRLTPAQAMPWVAARSGKSYPGALVLALRAWAFSSWQEKRNAFHMQRIFRNVNQAEALIQAAPEHQTYRNQTGIRDLFARLGLPIGPFVSTRSCHLVRTPAREAASAWGSHL